MCGDVSGSGRGRGAAFRSWLGGKGETFGIRKEIQHPATA